MPGTTAGYWEYLPPHYGNGALYPLLVFAVIVVTANHYWLDAAAGLLVAICSALVASRVLAPVRPAQWAFRPAPESAAI